MKPKPRRIPYLVGGRTCNSTAHNPVILREHVEERTGIDPDILNYWPVELTLWQLAALQWHVQEWEWVGEEGVICHFSGHQDWCNSNAYGQATRNHDINVERDVFGTDIDGNPITYVNHFNTNTAYKIAGADQESLLVRDMCIARSDPLPDNDEKYPWARALSTKRRLMPWTEGTESGAEGTQAFFKYTDTGTDHTETPPSPWPYDAGPPADEDLGQTSYQEIVMQLPCADGWQGMQNLADGDHPGNTNNKSEFIIYNPETKLFAPYIFFGIHFFGSGAYDHDWYPQYGWSSVWPADATYDYVHCGAPVAANTLTIDPVIAPSFEVPIYSLPAFSYDLTPDLAPPRQNTNYDHEDYTMTTNMTLRAKTFFEYKNKAGELVYDRTTGEQLHDPFG